MATDQAEVWGVDTGEVKRLRGKAFEAACLAATAFGIVSVLVLLLFVARDAFRPFSADTGWLLTVGMTVLLPLGALAAYYYILDEPAGEVAYVTTGLPIVGALLTGGFAVLFLELISVREWFALSIAIAASMATISIHARLRPHAALERLSVIVLAPIVAIFGAPPVEGVHLFNWLAGILDLPVVLSHRIVSLRELVLMAPILPADWLLVILSVATPVIGGAAWFVATRRDSRRAGIVTGGLALLGGSLGVFLGPLIGIGADAWALLVAFGAVPLGVYIEGVLRRREGTIGLVFPIVAILGIAVAAMVVRVFGFAGPDPWLDWEFLTNAHSRTPENAGIYPAMVGSVMMIVVIVVATFPVGVGAAIYLEEYAPSTGWAGRLVTLIEINIGNLAGVPSVVYGLLGLALFIRMLNWPQGSVIVGGLAVGLLILPIVIIAAQEAIRSVPDSFRQASYGMGATRWQTTKRVVLPEALPGILTGTILALGRAIGETAPLLMIGAAASVRLAPNGFFDLFSAMPRQIFSWSSELDPEFRHGVLAAGVITLLAVLLIMNATAIVIRNKYQRQR